MLRSHEVTVGRITVRLRSTYQGATTLDVWGEIWTTRPGTVEVRFLADGGVRRSYKPEVFANEIEPAVNTMIGPDRVTFPNPEIVAAVREYLRQFSTVDPAAIVPARIELTEIDGVYTARVLKQEAGWYVECDQRVKGGPFPSDGPALALLHRLQSSSWDHAIRYEGWVVRQLDAAGNEIDRVQPYSREG